MNESEVELTKSVAAMIEHCLHIGFELPLQMAAISINGAGMVFQYTAGEENLVPECLSDFTNGNNLMLPINFMITDSRGEAARIVLEQGAAAPRFIH